MVRITNLYHQRKSIGNVYSVFNSVNPIIQKCNGERKKVNMYKRNMYKKEVNGKEKEKEK